MSKVKFLEAQSSNGEFGEALEESIFQSVSKSIRQATREFHAHLTDRGFHLPALTFED